MHDIIPLIIGICMLIVGILMVIFRRQVTQMNENAQRRAGGDKRVAWMRDGLTPGATTTVGCFFLLIGAGMIILASVHLAR